MIDPKLLAYLRKTIIISWHSNDACEILFDDVTIPALLEAIQHTPELRQFVYDKMSDPEFMRGT